MRIAGGFSVVALGASAGGLDALCAFLDHLPAHPGFTCIVVTHQAPSVVSHLPSLLARHSKVEVTTVADLDVLAPDHVYVCPPGKLLSISSDRIRAHDAPLRQELPIDHLFGSLAAELGARAVAVVLSGTGSDGTLGTRQIKAAGGLVIAQEPSSAAHGGMPQSVIDAGVASAVMRPDEMPAHIATWASHGDAPSIAPDVLRRIVESLRARTGRDFSSYKATTIARRTLRRMAALAIGDAGSYAEQLQRDPFEVDRLFDDLLIGVTSFFRDPAVWDLLEREILPELVATTPPDRPFRAWVAGCATGEEAYSLAMLLRDAVRGREGGFQVFGTDLDAPAIETARAASYPASVAANVDPARVAKLFFADRERLRIIPQIRERVIFATHDLLSDPPFTRVDLVACRNVLIYMEPVLQAQVLRQFKYALRTGGVLVLGTSESIGTSVTDFEPLDQATHIFRRGEGTPFEVPVLGASVRVPDVADAARVGRAELARVVERVLATRYLPPSVVVDERGEIVHVHGRVGRYLELPIGRPSHNAFSMARPGLRLSLTSAVHAALDRGGRVVDRDIEVRDGDDLVQVDLVVEPLDAAGMPARLVLVSFETSLPREASSAGGIATEPRDAQKIRELEHEVDRTRDHLQQTIQQLEAANQELQSANEELQSANEELETSREEMQSLNEELQSINGELQRKVDRLSRVNDDMANLLESTDVATVFLDRDLRVRRFTRPVTELIPLLEADIGRPIADLAPTLQYPDLVADARQVLRTLAIHSTRLQGRDGRHYLARVLPYRTVDNVIDGVVLTFVDTTHLVHAQRLADSREIAASVVETVREPLLVLDDQLQVVSSNRAFDQAFGIARGTAAGVPLDQLGAGEWNLPDLHRRLVDVVEHDTAFENLDLGRMRLNGRRLRRGAGGPVLVLLAMEIARR